MHSFALHRFVLQGDLPRLKEILSSASQSKDWDINAYDEAGCTPLMYAVSRSNASLDLVRLLIEHGADVNMQTRRREDYPFTSDVMIEALKGGDPKKVELLLQCGARIRDRAEAGSGALLHAIHNRDIVKDQSLIELLKLLISNGVELNDISSYAESGLRVLSRLGRFDAVKLLLEAGAHEEQLAWTPLIRAVALGTLAEIRDLVERGVELEETDFWKRTAWLVALQTGDIAKAEFLRERGANTQATGRCGKPPLFYAIENHHLPMLRWLLEIGADIKETDDFDTTPLMTAVESQDIEALDLLLKAGAQVDGERNLGQTALSDARTKETAKRLLDAGADPQNLSREGRRSLLGLEPEENLNLFEVSDKDFQRQRTRQFGTSNPDRFQGSFYESMIRSGINAYQAARQFSEEINLKNSPVWCAQRFGQSITFLPDGRIIQIGGEHEDYYDPDFCIYNDVFVHKPDGTIDLYGYPETVFPPTDFHTATLMAGRFIWIIGSLGYGENRLYKKTPVYRLDTTSLQMEKIETTGECPGWIYKHTAIVFSACEICVSNGLIVTFVDDKEEHTQNSKIFILDTEKRRWSAT